jgi:hypothetical protein
MSQNDIQVAGSHYQSQMQHWDFVELNQLGYLEGNATKYLTRWRKKNGIQDLEKSLHYIRKLAEMAHLGQRQPRGQAPIETVIEFCKQNGMGDHELRATMRIARWTTMDDLKMAEFEIDELIRYELAEIERHAAAEAAKEPKLPHVFPIGAEFFHGLRDPDIHD